ncbi:MAG TPA: dihydroneopterin aldolase [Candidatus Thermoplasmatota archaeon]|nr:dihydroneopterin aldolase [Candidatus Thermoplasmatota archaeon]
MTDRVALRGVELAVRVGATSDERDVPQVLVVDVECLADLRAAGASDRLEDAVDYAAVHAAIVAAVRDRRFNLIEAVAEAIARAALGFSAEVKVRVAKRAPPIPGGRVALAEVVIERRRA